MTPTLLCILLLAAGIVLLVGEMLLPTHGALGIMGCGAIIAGISVGFYIHQWVGVSLLVAVIAATPVAWSAVLTYWPRTPLGKGILLPPMDSTVQPPHVGLGQTGVAVSELRPMGWCEFDDARHEVRSETGVIAAGSKVKVVSIESGRLIVRAA
jgi:membrane-bound ClpP family serine protease